MTVIIPPPPVLVYRAEVCPENAKLKALVTWWAASGPFPIKLLRGVTTDAEQLKLYAQGRWLPGNVVTNAKKASSSAHGHSGGLDAHPVRELYANGNVKLIYLGTEADPAVRAEALARFKTYADLAEQRFGLKSGRDFPGLVDWPHLQDPDWETLPLSPGVTA